jgi:hypothetical protein
VRKYTTQRNILIAAVLILPVVLVAQDPETAVTAVDTTWQKNLIANLNFNQANFDNWAQGGENSLAYQVNLFGKLLYQPQNIRWETNGGLKYGTSRIAEQSARKTIDEIRVNSVVQYTLPKFADPYFAVTAETQLAPGYLYSDANKVQLSDFMDPGYFTQGIGLGIQPLEGLMLRAGGAVKETVTDQYPVPFADDPDTDKIEKIKVEAGVEGVADLQKAFNETTLLESRLEIFSDLESAAAIDLRWDTKLTAKVSEIIQFSANVVITYDRDISLKRQLYQTLALGISYTIF